MRKEVNERGKARRRHVPEINVKTEEVNVKIEVILFEFAKLCYVGIDNYLIV
jgi:hypothetical protein